MLKQMRRWIKDRTEVVRYTRLLRNGRTVFGIVRGSNDEIRSLDFWDGTRLWVQDSASAAHIFAEIFLAGHYDVHEVRAAHRIVDVGANIGLFSYFARRQNPDAEIIAIEADPSTARVLQQNVEEKRIEVLNYVISDQSGIVNFYSSTVSGWSSLYNVRGAAGSHEIQVPGMRLSKLLQGRGIAEIGLLKIDVEGAEYPILLEDEALWETAIDAIIVEVDRNPRDVRYSYEQLYGRLRDIFQHVVVDSDVTEYPLIYAKNKASI